LDGGGPGWGWCRLRLRRLRRWCLLYSPGAWQHRPVARLRSHSAMTVATLPTLFLSHGSPMLPFEDIPARKFIAGLGSSMPRPEAILCISAHWETDRPAVSGAARPETVHDFYGFPEELYRLRYPAPGAPALARRVAALIEGVVIDESQGLD